jgi:carboxypeptidase Q
MTTIRRHAAILFAAFALVSGLTVPVTTHAARGPSTADERARVVKIAAESRKDPIATAAANGDWFEQWISDVPDVHFRPEGVAKWCLKSAKGDLRKVIQFQFGANYVAYQLEHNLPDPQKPEDVSAVNLAALEGVLAAYETLLAQDPKNRSTKMDEALARRSKGELAAFAATIGAQ